MRFTSLAVAVGLIIGGSLVSASAIHEHMDGHDSFAEAEAILASSQASEEHQKRRLLTATRRTHGANAPHARRPQQLQAPLSASYRHVLSVINQEGMTLGYLRATGSDALEIVPTASEATIALYDGDGADRSNIVLLHPDDSPSYFALSALVDEAYVGFGSVGRAYLRSSRQSSRDRTVEAAIWTLLSGLDGTMQLAYHWVNPDGTTFSGVYLDHTEGQFVLHTDGESGDMAAIITLGWVPVTTSDPRD